MRPSKPLSTHHDFLFEATRQTLSVAELKALFGIAGLIRIQAWDWHLVPEASTPFWHFNLGATPHGAGERYALTKILRPGTREGAREVRPLLDPTDLRVATVLRTGHTFELPYIEDLPPTRFLLASATREALSRELCRRYGVEPERLSEMLCQSGLSMTLLTISEKLSLNPPPAETNS